MPLPKFLKPGTGSEAAGLITGLRESIRCAWRFGRACAVRSHRRSSPKLQVLNTALITALSGLSLDEARTDREFWGRLVESAVGAHLANAAASDVFELFYWRDRGREVDFVVRCGRALVAIEVKSGRSMTAPPGLAAFSEAFRPRRTLLVGGDGIPIEEFLLTPVEHWVRP